MSKIDERVGKDVLERAVLPVAIPLATIVVVEIVVFAFSRVLLTAGKTPAAVIALLVAMGILFGAAAIAAAPRIKPSTIQGLLVLTLLATVGAGAWAFQRGPAEIEHAGGGGSEEHPDEPSGSGEFAITAANLAFDHDELEAHAGEAFTLLFVNDDASIPHNVSIYADDSLDTELFIGEIFNGVAERRYKIPALAAGEYYFQCDVHPAMHGTVVAG